METPTMSSEVLVKEVASVISLIESGDKESLSQRIQESNDVQRELSARDSRGRTALDIAALLGKAEIAQVLVSNGAELNKANKSGYTALHHSAAWGHKDCLKVLISLGADHLPTTRHAETARDIAQRYGKSDCMEYLDAVDSRSKLSRAIKSAKDILGDSERYAGKWNKDDRSKVNGLCNEKNDWLQHNENASSKAVEQQIVEFEGGFQPYLAKLAPPEST